MLMYVCCAHSSLQPFNWNVNIFQVGAPWRLLQFRINSCTRYLSQQNSYFRPEVHTYINTHTHIHINIYTLNIHTYMYYKEAHVKVLESIYVLCKQKCLYVCVFVNGWVCAHKTFKFPNANTEQLVLYLLLLFMHTYKQTYDCANCCCCCCC